MTTNRLRVGVIGLAAGEGHVADYTASASVEEVVICDMNEQRLGSIGDKYQVKKRYANFADMLDREKLDAVSIALPNKLHSPMTIQAIESGCHVLCEKPMARTADEAGPMQAAAQRHGKKLMINFNHRFVPVHQALKAVIDAGELGDIYYARSVWHRRRGVPWWYPLANGKDMCGGGPVIDLGVHVLDRTLWWCGFPQPQWVLGNTFSKIAPQEAAARGIPTFELEDMGVAMIRMHNGMMLELESSWASNRENETVSTRLYGTKGGAVIRDSEGNQTQKLFLDIAGKHCDVEFHRKSLPPGPNIRQAFLNAILNDTEVPCTPAQGLLVNRILDAIYQSAHTGAPVAMPGTAAVQEQSAR